jgi:muramoyltetrapeptide carboxypeptidase
VGWNDDYYGPSAATALRQALMSPAPITIPQDPDDPMACIVIGGTAQGVLMGGNISLIGTAVGWACPSFDGAILLLEAVDTPIGRIDSTLTQLSKSGLLTGVRGVAVGQFIRSAEQVRPGKWSAIDVIRDHFGPLGIPVLGGLPIGHGPRPPTVPLGTRAVLDASARTLTVEPGVS